MPAKEIMLEATALYKVSESLESLADEHAPIAEGLEILARKVREAAILLEILVQLRLGPNPELDRSMN